MSVIVVEEEKLKSHLDAIEVLHRSRALLAFCTGALYGNLHQVKYMLEQPLDFTPPIKAKLVDAIADTLHLVSPILEKEFYPDVKATPAAPSAEPTP